MTTPRPVLAVVSAARAISSGQAGPGSAAQAARAGRPAASASRNEAPAGYRAHEPGSGRAGGPGSPAGGRAATSVAACRCGTASRSTSASVPA